MKRLKERLSWHFLGVICCAVLLGATPAAEFASGLWPGEGWPRFAAKVSVSVLRRDPDLESPVAARFATKRGAPIEFDDTRYRMVKAGEVVAIANGVLKARKLGKLDFFLLRTIMLTQR